MLLACSSTAALLGGSGKASVCPAQANRTRWPNNNIRDGPLSIFQNDHTINPHRNERSRNVGILMILKGG
jgi:hypothetical protein